MNKKLFIFFIIGLLFFFIFYSITNKNSDTNQDEVKNDLTIIANSVQSLWARPMMMGGANRDFTNLSEEEILKFVNVPASEYKPEESEARNANGTYTVEIIGNTELAIRGEPVSGPPTLQINVRREDTGQWTVEFSEVGEDDSGGGGGAPQRGTDS